ncbi:MAG: rRNA maturation RNase YbeY [Oscillospiraceae bacterium]|jgi:probable rRNA maturation factor
MHRVTISNASGYPALGVKRLIRRSVIKALEFEGVNIPCEANVLIVDNEAIRELNRKFRSVDSVTDVLSFPMHELKPGEKPSETEPDGYCHLGDIVISIQKARSQASVFGHGLKRETAYLIVHSVLHLLGYDHVDEAGQKAQMRGREEEILRNII